MRTPPPERDLRRLNCLVWPYVCLGAAIILASCSFTAIQRLPSPPADDIVCTDELTFPLIDMAGTVLSGLLAISLLSAGDDAERDASLTSAGIASGVLALGLASSAVYGTYQVNRCQGARNAGSAAPDVPLGSRPAAGSEGGACLSESRCDDDLVCDAPMQTCVPPAED